jgi:hypothetical protein
MDRFRPRPTPDELRGCHDNDAGPPSPDLRDSPALPSRPAAQPPTNQPMNQPTTNLRSPEQPTLQHTPPERDVVPFIPR